MATTKQVNDFISAIAPIIQKYAKKYGYKVASPIIAQACLESGYGLSKLGATYHNYFGMKCGTAWTGKSVNMNTKEEYKPGTITDIKANFRVYDSMEEGVKGYFEFISKPRYENLKTAKTAKDYLEKIKADGYATNSTYVANNMAVITKYDLTRFDTALTIHYFKKYTGTTTSIQQALISLGEKGDFNYRSKIAVVNNISNYKGSAEQNIKMLNLLKKGKLIKP